MASPLTPGIRFEQEYLPGEAQAAAVRVAHPINFGWGDKIAPRIGAAWDVFQDGRMKVFGSYGSSTTDEAEPGDQFVRWPVLAECATTRLDTANLGSTRSGL